MTSIKLDYKPKLFLNNKLIITKKHLLSYKKRRRNIKAISDIVIKYNEITNQRISLTPKTLLWRNYNL